MTDELWTIEQVAAHLGIQPGSARGLLSRRKIRRADVGESDAGRLRALYRVDEIRALAASRRPGTRTDLTPQQNTERHTMKLTPALLAQLIDAPHEDPVIYLERDDETGEVTGLGVWAEALVPHADIVVRHEELADQLGDDPQGAERTTALQHLAASWQDDVDAALDAS